MKAAWKKLCFWSFLIRAIDLTEIDVSEGIMVNLWELWVTHTKSYEKNLDRPDLMPLAYLKRFVKELRHPMFMLLLESHYF